MEEQMIQPMLVGEGSCSSGILRCLCENLRIHGKNMKVMVSNMLLVLLPFCLLALGVDLALTPVTTSIISKLTLLSHGDPNSFEAKQTVEEILKNVRLLLGLEMVFLVAFGVASLLSLIATFFFRKELNMKDLFSRIYATSKKTIITWFYITFFGVVLVVLVLISIGVFSVAITGLDLIVLCIMGLLLGTLGYFYLSAVLMLSLVMFIVEEEFYGLMALGKAEELIKGRRIQGFFLMLLSSIVSVAITAVFASKSIDINEQIGSRLEDKIVVFCLFFVVKIFFLFMYTVFYYECKRRHGEQVEVEERYSPIAVSVV